MKQAIAYYRVSTDRQGKSGLGLDAQQQNVRTYIDAHGLELAGEYTEVESGRKNRRPILLQALDACRKQKAVLVIAKLDRLGRNVAFISSLMEAKIDFVAVDNPHANRLMLHLLAAFAEHEREQISTRTKEALAAAKRRGVILGRNGKEKLALQNRQTADEFAINMFPIIKELREAGNTTIRSILIELENRNIPTFRNGKRWHLKTVNDLIRRIQTLA